MRIASVQCIKLITLTFLFTFTLFGASTSCGGIYFLNTAPDFLNTKLKTKTKELCLSEFALMHSGIARTPLWSAQHLTKDMRVKKGVRSTYFHAEEQLGQEERAEIIDYIGSHFDKGQLSFATNASDPMVYREFFSLANIVPQNHTNKVGAWSRINENIQMLLQMYGEVYVISGPLFLSRTPMRIHNRVLVPTKLFKAVYIPSRGEGSVYVTKNSMDKELELISMAELEKISGISFFPKMGLRAKMTICNFPMLKSSKEEASPWKKITHESR